MQVVESGARYQVPHTTVIAPPSGLSLPEVGSIVAYRELLFFLVWRDLKVRYKQTVLGVAWIVLQPVISIVIFSVLFGRLLGVPSNGVPYPIFAYAALLPWNYFAGALTRASTSVVNSAHLITKVYFPRTIIPISAVLSGLVDFAIAFGVLALLMFYYRFAPTLGSVLLPLMLLLALVTALGFGLWLAALNVRFRDINHLVPFLVQSWMYITPVIYGTDILPERFRFLLALNPMTSVVEGFRWALLAPYLDEIQPIVPLFAVAVPVSLLVFAGGLMFFHNTERVFADVI